MGLRTMASPNGAQAPEYSQAIGNHDYDDIQRYFPEFGKCKMNIEELVMQQLQAPASSSSSSSASIALPLPADFNPNGTLSPKTIHDVLRGITVQEERSTDERLTTIGKTTNESILIQAGASNLGYEGRSHSLLAVEPVVEQQHKWVQYEPDASKQQQQQSMGFMGSTLSMFANDTVNAMFSESQQVGMSVGSVAIANSIPSDSQMLVEINRNDEIVDKSIERRQKRMIKNRESAARSRARKQAYINQLEDKVKELEDTNMRLKRQMEEMLSHSDSMPEPRYQLRRTSSAPF